MKYIYTFLLFILPLITLAEVKDITSNYTDWVLGGIGSLILGLLAMSLSLYVKNINDKRKQAELKIEEEEGKRLEQLNAILDKIEESMTKMEEVNTSQDKRMDQLQADFDTLKTLLKEVDNHLKLDDKKNELKRIIKKESAKFIKFNQDIKANPEFSGMVTLLNAGRDATINLGVEMLFINSDDVTEETLADDVWSIFDSLKIVANSHVAKDFARSLRQNTKIKAYAESLVFNLYEIKQGKYNGSTFKQLKNTLIKFMTNVFTEAITLWRTQKDEIIKLQVIAK